MSLEGCNDEVLGQLFFRSITSWRVLGPQMFSSLYALARNVLQGRAVVGKNEQQHPWRQKRRLEQQLQESRGCTTLGFDRQRCVRRRRAIPDGAKSKEAQVPNCKGSKSETRIRRYAHMKYFINTGHKASDNINVFDVSSQQRSAQRKEQRAHFLFFLPRPLQDHPRNHPHHSGAGISDTHRNRLAKPPWLGVGFCMGRIISFFVSFPVE